MLILGMSLARGLRGSVEFLRSSNPPMGDDEFRDGLCHLNSGMALADGAHGIILSGFSVVDAVQSQRISAGNA